MSLQGPQRYMLMYRVQKEDDLLKRGVFYL